MRKTIHRGTVIVTGTLQRVYALFAKVKLGIRSAELGSVTYLDQYQREEL